MMLLGATNPVDHVVPHYFWNTSDGVVIWNQTVGNLVLYTPIFLLFMWWVSRKIQTGSEAEGSARYVTKNPVAHCVEVICIYLRNEVIEPLLHDRTERFLPFLWTLFFFILFHNLMGLIPITDLLLQINGEWRNQHRAPFGGTTTQNVVVTAVLAFVSFLVINISGIRRIGIGGYLAHLTGGAPMYVWPILVPVELLGIFIKPAALAIRLFANMTAGHVLMATMLMFIGMVWGSFNILLTPTVTVISAVALIAIYFLEIFVAFLQAFVFMFLTAVFIAMLDHHDHDEVHGEAAAAH